MNGLLSITIHTTNHHTITREFSGNRLRAIVVGLLGKRGMKIKKRVNFRGDPFMVNIEKAVMIILPRRRKAIWRLFIIARHGC